MITNDDLRLEMALHSAASSIASSNDGVARAIRNSNDEVAKSNKEVSSQLKAQNELLKKDLDTKDRVDISKSEYLELLDYKKEAMLYKDRYFGLIRPILSSTDISDEIKRKIVDGNIETPQTIVQINKNYLDFTSTVFIRYAFKVEDR